MRSRTAVLMAVVALTFTSGTIAAPVSYNEAVDGDLRLPNLGPPQVVPPFTAFNFDIGTNTISGTSSLHSTDGQDALNDKDPFTFTIAAGTHLHSASISFLRTQLAVGVTELLATYYLTTGDCVPHCGPPLTVGGIDLINGISPLPLFMQLGPGTYSVLQSFNIGPAGVVDSLTGLAAYSYVLSFNVAEGDGDVAEVPEPNALSLVLTALGLSLAARRLRLSAKKPL